MNKIFLTAKKFSIPKQIIVYIALFLILILAMWSRQYTFWLPHWQGDQHQYAALGMKLASSNHSPDQYNLKNLKIRFMNFNDPPHHRLAALEYLPNDEGDFIRAYKAYGLAGYYDLDFFYKAPLFPSFIALVHSIISENKKVFMVVNSNLGNKVRQIKPNILLKAQLWVTIIPYVSSILILVVVFLIGRLIFDNYSAIIATFLMGTNPVSLVSSNRVLTEDLQTFFLSTSMLLTYIAVWKKRRDCVLWSGIVLGLAILTNQKSLMLMPAIIIFLWIYSPGVNFYKSRRLIDLIKALFLNQYVWIFLVTVLFITLHWFGIIHSKYGSPFWQPDRFQVIEDSPINWFSVLYERPHPIIFFSVGVIYLCPPFIGAYFSLTKIVKVIRGTDLKSIMPWVFLWLWWAFIWLYYLLGFSDGSEHRYLQPSYPALCLMSGAIWNGWRIKSKTLFRHPVYSDIFLWIFLAVIGHWMISTGWEVIFEEQFLFLKKPF